jgi:hypothetical protein
MIQPRRELSVKRFALLLAAAALGAGVTLMTTARPTHAQNLGEQRKLKWERLEVELEAPPRQPVMIESERQRLVDRMACYRTKVPGGWLVMSPRGGVTHLPDPEWTWNGSSLR